MDCFPWAPVGGEISWAMQSLFALYIMAAIERREGGQHNDSYAGAATWQVLAIGKGIGSLSVMGVGAAAAIVALYHMQPKRWT